MTQVYQNASKTVLLRLFNESTGEAMTGITYDQVTCSALKANGTQTDFSPLVGEWAPCASGAAAARGFYRLTVAAAAFDVLDDVAVIVNVPGSQCPALRFEVVPAKVVDVQTRLGAPAGSSLSADLATVLAAIGLRPQLADMIASALAKQAKVDALDGRLTDARAAKIDTIAVDAAAAKANTNGIGDTLSGIASNAAGARTAAEATDLRLPATPASSTDLAGVAQQTTLQAVLEDTDALDTRVPAAPAAQADVQAVPFATASAVDNSTVLAKQVTSDALVLAVAAIPTAPLLAADPRIDSINGKVAALPADPASQAAVLAAMPPAPANAEILAMEARLPATPASQNDVAAGAAAVIAALPAEAPSAAQVADAVHDEQLADHLAPGSAGRALAELKALKTCFVVDDIERNPQTLQITARLRGFASRADALAGTNPLITLENVNVAAVDQRLVRSARVTEPAP